MKYYSAIKRNEALPFATTWLELESIMLSEMSQSEKDLSYDLTHMWDLKNKSAKGKKGKSRNRPLAIENKLMVQEGR